MKRGLATSGGPGHIALVKLASKKIIETFDDLREIMIDYEPNELRIAIRIDERWGSGYSTANFDFRPDIVVRTSREVDPEKPWLTIKDSMCIVFEAETNPRNIFNNAIKIEGYKRVRDNRLGRASYGLVLVCWSDAKLPKNTEPFDEIWKFDKATGNRLSTT